MRTPQHHSFVWTQYLGLFAFLAAAVAQTTGIVLSPWLNGVLSGVLLLGGLIVAWSFYSLLIGYESAMLRAPAGEYVTNYMGQLVRRHGIRCLVIVGAVLVAGLYHITSFGAYGWALFREHWMILAQLASLLVIEFLVFYVMLVLQPRIRNAFSDMRVGGSLIRGASTLTMLRANRKRVASVYLVAILIVILMAAPFSGLWPLVWLGTGTIVIALSLIRANRISAHYQWAGEAGRASVR